MFRFLILATLINVVLFGCKKNDTNVGNDYGTHYLEDTKLYTYFKEGTWWVYENSRTLEKDSITVYASFLDTITYFDSRIKNSPRITKEYFEWYAVNVLDGTEYVYWTQSPYLFEEATESFLSRYKIRSYRWDSNNSGGENNVFGSPYSEFETGQGLTYLGGLDSMMVNNKLFYDVVMFRNEIDYSNHVKPTTYYWCSGIGIIEILNEYDSSTVSLKDYNIVQ